MRIAPLVALTATLPFLPAQAPVSSRASDPIVFRMQGPARVRAAFLATNVGTLLASKDAGDFWSLTKGAFRARLRGAGDELGGCLAAAVEGLDGYAGTITVAADLTPHPEAWAGVAPDLGGVLVMEPDGRTDLAALAASVREGLRGSKWKVESVEVAGVALELVRTSERGGVALPAMIGDRLVAFFGENLEGAIAARLGTDQEAFVPDAAFARAPVALRVDLQRLVALEMQDPSYETTSTSPEDVAKVSGLASLRELRLLLRPNGPYVELDSSVSFAPGVERGFFAGFMPATQEAPALAALVPEGARYWQAGKLRPDLIVKAGIEMVAAWSKSADDPLDASVKHIREQLREFAGCELDREVFAHLDDDCVVLGSLFGSPDADSAEPDAVGAGGGKTVMFAFGLKDRAAFEKGWETLLGSAVGAFLPREEQEALEGTTLHVSRELSWALCDDVFLVGFGDAAPQWTRAVLSRRRAILKDERTPVTLPREVERRLKQGPAGFQGCGGFDVGALLGVPIFDLLDLDAQVAEIVGTGWTRVFESLRPFLAQHELERAVSLVGWADDRWTYRVLW